MRLELPPVKEGPLIRSVFHLYMAIAWVARALPERFVYGFAHWAGRTKARLTWRQRRLVAVHMARITGKAVDSLEVRDLVLDAYASYARYWVETFRYAQKGPEFWNDRSFLRGEHLDRVLAEGRGAVVLVAHSGNWDAAGAYMAVTGRDPVTVAEVVRPRRLYEFFVAHRERLGMTIYPAVHGVSRVLIDELRSGALVALLADRDLKGTGPEVTFFDEPTTFPAGPASLALIAKVPLLVGAVHSHVFDDGRRGWQATVSEPIELPAERSRDSVRALTQEAAVRLEELIRPRPEEWHVFSPFWLEERNK